MKSQILLCYSFLFTSFLSLPRYNSAQSIYTSNYDDDISNDDRDTNGSSSITSAPLMIANTMDPLPSFDSSITPTSSPQPAVTATPIALADGNLTYVKDSGICETTPGVHQVSGYINTSKGIHLVGLCLLLKRSFLCCFSGSGSLLQGQVHRPLRWLFGWTGDLAVRPWPVYFKVR